ncbi:g5377 [Coccomyxa viridis]|uniref:G5377 protein n=1 Tax=Coccomyxa viridis TaxID=1274662 RepID=A0ABP1FU26_9CHLO
MQKDNPPCYKVCNMSDVTLAERLIAQAQELEADVGQLEEQYLPIVAADKLPKAKGLRDTSADCRSGEAWAVKLGPTFQKSWSRALLVEDKNERARPQDIILTRKELEKNIPREDSCLLSDTDDIVVKVSNAQLQKAGLGPYFTLTIPAESAR